jgi:hypothetical protein
MPADDAPAFLLAAAEIVALPKARSHQSVETLFDTAHAFDAGSAGYDGPTDTDDGGFRVVFDGRWNQPQVILNGQDGEITITGYSAIKCLTDALMDAEKKAKRMGGA